MREFRRVLWAYKIWWIAPLALIAVLMTTILLLAGLYPASPFRYTLF